LKERVSCAYSASKQLGIGNAVRRMCPGHKAHFPTGRENLQEESPPPRVVPGAFEKVAEGTIERFPAKRLLAGIAKKKEYRLGKKLRPVQPFARNGSTRASLADPWCVVNEGGRGERGLPA